MKQIPAPSHPTPRIHRGGKTRPSAERLPGANWESLPCPVFIAQKNSHAGASPLTVDCELSI